MKRQSAKAILLQRAGLTLAGIQAGVKSLFANIDSVTEEDERELMRIYNDIRRVSGRAIGIDTDAEDARDEARLAAAFGNRKS